MVNRCGGDIQTLRGFYSPTHLSTSTDLANPLSPVSSPADSMGSKNSPDGLRVSDEDFASIAAHIVSFSLGTAMGRHCQRPDDLLSRKSQGFYPPTHLSTSTDLTSPLSPASSLVDSMGSENSPDGLRVSDANFAPNADHIVSFGIGIALGRQCQWSDDLVSRKRRSSPDAEMEADPRGWGFESGDPGVVSQWDARNAKKRRRTTEYLETGVGPAAQGDQSRVLPVRRTPERLESKSKLGQGLGMETLVAPLQGVSPPLALGPSIIGATPEPYEYASQAWTEGSEDGSLSGETVSIQDAHDEDETDRERWRRLMCYTQGRWVCLGCDGRPFFDRCTLQRHCKSAVHAKERDSRGCPFCPKAYLRSSNVRRHIRNKHPEEWETMV